MGIISEKIELEHFSKTGFIRLTEHIIDQLSPRMVYFAQNKPENQQHIEIHPDFFLDVPLSGQKHVIYGDGHNFNEKILSPGEILYCRPFSWKQCQWDYPHEMACFIYKEDFIRITYVDIPETLPPQIYPKTTCFLHTELPPTEAIHNLLSTLSILSETGDPGNSAPDIIRGLFRLTIELLKNDHSKTFSQSETTFNRIQQYLHDNFHANINRKYVAHVFNLNPGYVSRLYKENCQKSFFETLYTLRMDHASILLKNTEQKIHNIAASCGYDSLPSFNVAFKKYSGLSPGKFRQLYRNSLPGID